MNEKRSKLNQLKVLYNIPSMDLEDKYIRQEEIQHLVDTLISLEICNLDKILPLKLLPQNPPCLIIGMVNPDNLEAENDILRIVRSKKLQWQKVVILEEDFKTFLPRKKPSNTKFSPLKTALISSDYFKPFENSLLQCGYVGKELLKQALIKARNTEKSLIKILEEITQQTLPIDLKKRYKQVHLFELQIVYGVNSFDIDTEEIDLSKIAELMESIVPIEVCLSYKLIPLQLLDDDLPVLVIAMVNPDDLEALDNVKKLLRPQGLGVKRIVITEADYDKLLTKHYEVEKQRQEIKEVEKRKQELDKLGDVSNFIDYVDYAKEEEDLANVNTVNQPPIVRLINNIFIKAIKEKVEEIYIQSQQNSLSVQFRKNGQKKEYFNLPKEITIAVINRIKLIANLNPTMKLNNQKTKITQIFNNRKYEFMMNIIRGDYGENIYLQNLKNPEISFDLNNLIIDESVVNNLRNLIKSPPGLIIITGGNKTRKTVVSYGLLTELAKDYYNIYTIEDITSYNLSGVTQISTLDQKNQSSASIFKEILEQNSDIIYVNKLTDANIAKQVFSAVSQGKLIIAEMDFYQIEHILFKFLEWGIKPSEIALNLKAIINQRLIRQVCSNCRTSYNPSPETLSLFKGFNWTNNPQVFYNTTVENYNCFQCRGTGYQDMIIINEIMEFSPDMQRLILKDETILDIHKEAIKKGMSTLLFNGLKLVDSGLTTLEEIEKVLGDSIAKWSSSIELNDNNSEEIIENEKLDDDFQDLWF